jgi:3-deoxy-D-manno-octulosonic-acid transferase
MSGKDTFESLRARFACDTRKRAQRPTLWCHAASIGEFKTLETLLPRLKSTYAENDILITTSNIIAFESAQAWSDAQVHVAVAPLDYKSVLTRFLKLWAPIALITVENELFPNRTIMTKNAGAKVIWLNARMSPQSFKFWQKHRPLTDQVINSIDFVFAQDTTAFERFEMLGVSTDKLVQTQNLKKYYYATPVTHPDLDAVSRVFPYEKTICAASTHLGEDEVLLNAFKIAIGQDPELKMIIAPRHSKRAPAIATLIKKTGLSFATRSKGELPSHTDQVYLADTIGELPIWYTACATTFVAGSLLPIGGHTPFEPTAYGSVIIHGQYFSNFQDIYTGLHQANGSIMANTPAEIAKAWSSLRTSENRQQVLDAAKQRLLDADNMEKTINDIVLKTKSIIG